MPSPTFAYSSINWAGSVDVNASKLARRLQIEDIDARRVDSRNVLSAVFLSKQLSLDRRNVMHHTARPWLNHYYSKDSISFVQFGFAEFQTSVFLLIQAEERKMKLSFKKQ